MNATLSASSSSLEMKKDCQLRKDTNGPEKEEVSYTVQYSTERKEDTSLNMSRDLKDPSKRHREILDELSDSEEEPHILRRCLRGFRKVEEKLKVRILELAHECACHAAVARQYRTKVKNMRTMAMAALVREDLLIEKGNSEYENGNVNGAEVASDNEDKETRNTVAYSDVDNELFQNKN